MVTGESQVHSADVALFVDWENLKFSLASRGERPNLTALLEIVRKYGRLVIARAYADWQDDVHLLSRDQVSLYYAGIEPVFVPTRKIDDEQIRRKNSVDVKLCADCMDVSFLNENVSLIILVSGDADFIHLANSLRSRGKRVVMIGVSGATASRLVESVDELLYYDEQVRANVQEQSIPETKGVDPEEAATKALVELVKEQRELQRFPLLSWLGIQIRSRLPRFSLEEVGFSKFKDFALKVEREGLIKLATFNLVDYVLLPEDPLPQSENDVAVERDSDPVAPKKAAPKAKYRAALTDVAQTCVELERNPRYTNITKTFLANCLENKANGEYNSGVPVSEDLTKCSLADMHDLINEALAFGILLSTHTLDPDTGREWRCVVPNYQNDLVLSLQGP